MLKVVKIGFLLGFSFFSFMELFAEDKYAIIIGVGNYPEETGWYNINGDKDIALVKDYLLCNGFQESNLIVLRNEKATALNIRNTFSQLLSNVQSGTVVYIHFSGHGQLVVDLNGDEDDGYDESWVPYDAHAEYTAGVYEGNSHILDDELNMWLHNIRTKIGPLGKLTVVSDACHSGTLSAQIIKISRSIAYSLAQVSMSNEKIKLSNEIRGVGGAFKMPKTKSVLSSTITAPIDWVMISACESHQCNFEYLGQGSLTYALSAHKSLLSKQPCALLMDSITCTIKNTFLLSQTPVLECSQSQIKATIL